MVFRCLCCCHSSQKSLFCLYQKHQSSESKVKFTQASTLQQLIYPRLLRGFGILVFFKNLSLTGFQVRHLALFLLFSVIHGFEWFWRESLCKNIQLILEFFKAPFLVQHFSCYTWLSSSCYLWYCCLCWWYYSLLQVWSGRVLARKLKLLMLATRRFFFGTTNVKISFFVWLVIFAANIITLQFTYCN